MSESRPRGAWAGRRSGLVGALASGLLTSLGAYLALELWRARLTVPFRYYQIDDTKFYLGLVKGMLENGWYLHNPSLGAPFGQALYDFPQGADNLNFVVIKAIGFFSSDYAVVTNLFFLLTFPLTGLAAYWALRRLGVGPVVASVCSVLFALLPFHFYRHESQVLLSAYYPIPLGAYLFLSLLGDKPLLTRRDGGRRAPLAWASRRSLGTRTTRTPAARRPSPLAWASRRSLGTVGICLVIGSAGLYYAVFTIVLLVAGTLAAMLGGGGRRAVVTGAVACTAIVLTLSLNLAPSLLYGARHGANPRIVRTPLESEQLGLRLSNLVLPVRGHRLAPLSNVNARYAAETSPGYCESCNETLGVVGAIGFVLLCLIALATCAAAAAPAHGSRRLDWQRPYRPAALGVAIALAIGTTGGLSALIAFLITPDVRAWNRISLFIAFFSLLAIALLLEAAGRRLRGGDWRPRRRALSGALLVAVLVLGVLDETSNYFVVNYAASAREYRSDAAFGRAIQSRLPPGTSVLELPYVPFPEGYHVAGQPPASAFSTSYDLLRPYLNTRGLRWSFGALKGRPTDWEEALTAKRLDIVVAAAAAAGFQAIYVDAKGYDPTTAKQVLAGLTGLTGAGPLVSPRKDAWLFDLRSYLRQLSGGATPGALAAVREATLRPLRTACGSTPADLILNNPARTTRAATLSLSLVAPLPPGVTVSIAFPGGAGERLTLNAAAANLERRLLVAPGRSKVRFSIVGPAPFGAAPGTPAFVVSEPTLTDDAFAPFLARPAGASALLPVAGLLGPTCSDLYAASAASHFPSAFPPRPAPRRPRAAAF